MNRITLANARISMDIKIDKKLKGKVYFTIEDQRANGKQLVSINAVGNVAETLKNVFKKGDFINIEGRLNTYNVNNYSVSATYVEKSCVPQHNSNPKPKN